LVIFHRIRVILANNLIAYICVIPLSVWDITYHVSFYFIFEIVLPQLNMSQCSYWQNKMLFLFKYIIITHLYFLLYAFFHYHSTFTGCLCVACSKLVLTALWLNNNIPSTSLRIRITSCPNQHLQW
jgi:hypothetical protein